MKIPLKLIPPAYQISKKVYEGKFTRPEGLTLLVNKGLNKNTASNYIYNFRCLKDGEKFGKTLNIASMEYFFEHLLNDYGVTQLAKPLSSLFQHISYYEKVRKNKAILHGMRAIHKEYSAKTGSPILISNNDQLFQNIKAFEYYLTQGNDKERKEASSLLQQGICFVAYKTENELRFAPSKFLGYEHSELFKHPKTDKDGRETNDTLNSILKSKPLADKAIEKKYLAYCLALGITPQPKGAFGHTRKYWTHTLKQDLHNNNEITGEFPEGRIIEQAHKTRERSSKVVLVAKENFKRLHGKLYCQVCDFDFEEWYGDHGKDFIEGHHTLAVSQMPPGYQTKPEEIAMLCGNCHRMAHKRRPWLTMGQLSKLRKKK
jgi:hypothetical protein